MKTEPIIASAPGNLMLLGEHAVLHGRAALVAATDVRLQVVLAPRSDDLVRIRSTLGEHETTLAALDDAPAFRFVMAALRRVRERLPSGLDLEVRSGFSSRVGLGSSAAVTAAMVAALAQWTGAPGDPAALFAAGLDVIRTVQGLGSGADLAACVHGGVVRYRMTPRELEPIAGQPELVLVYSGYKTPTPEVVRQVEARRQRHPELFTRVFDAMDTSVAAAVPALANGDWRTLGEIMNFNHGLLDALGVNTPELAEIVFRLRRQPGIHGAKISGSGLGDCVVGLGRTDPAGLGYELIPVAVAHAGVRLE